MVTATATNDVLDAIPPTDDIRARLKATREEAAALRKMLTIAVRRDSARELRSRSVQTAGR